MATIAQQGEDITLTIKGDENADLDTLNFAVTLYLPNGDENDIHTFYKKSENFGIFTKPQEEGVDVDYVWIGVIPSEETANMKVGTYNMELLTGTGEDTNRSIYVNKNFLTIEYSVSQGVSLK